MLYLVLAVICGATFAILFKIFGLRRIDTLQAVAFNYLTAFVLGLVMNLAGGGEAVNPFTTRWFWPAIVMGVGFMAAFVLMSASTARSGVAITTISARVSLVIPVVCSWLLFDGQPTPPWLPIGLVVAALAIIFWPRNNVGAQGGATVGSALFPIGVFLLFGLNNFCLKYVQNSLAAPREFATLTATIFISAMLSSVGYYVVKNRGRVRFSVRSMLGGIVLGTANYFATYLTLLALGTIAAGVFFPVYNVSIVVISVAAGVLFFGERLSKTQIAGICIAILGIIMFFVKPDWIMIK